MVVIQGVTEGREKKERRDYGMGATVWEYAILKKIVDQTQKFKAGGT